MYFFVSCARRSIGPLLFALALVACLSPAAAQTSRSRNRSGQVYRNYYQRMAGSGNAGQRFSIRNGQLFASGKNGLGQLGDASTADRSSQVQVGTGSNWVIVSSDSAHSLGIRADGTLWAWGFNAYGELGDGSTTTRISPVQIGTGTSWTAVSCGLYHSIALRNDGTVWTWGLNASGQLGLGSTTNGSSPVQVTTLNNITAIAAGREHCLALRADGTLWAWGGNAAGQIGTNGTATQTAPVQVGTATSWTTIAAGGNASFGIRANGTLWAFGDNQYGQLGDGTAVSRSLPTQIGTDQNWVSLAAGNSHTLALKSNGTLWAWGRNANGQLGDGSVTSRSAPVQVGNRSDFVQAQAGAAFSSALSADGVIRCWGDNGSGVFGTGSTASSLIPVTVESAPAQWLQASISYHNMHIKADGTLWGVGYNAVGMLGDGTNTDRSTPVQIGLAQNWVSVACGEQFTLGLTADGKLYSWGYNPMGQLGTNNTTARNVPGQIGSAISWSQVATGLNHAAGISSDGKLYAWGDNAYGQVGDGTSNNQRLVPTQIGSATDWVSVVCASNSTVALKADGTVYSWGVNTTGTLGLGHTTTRTAPTLVAGSNYTAIAAGGNYVMALRANGSLWAWGYNGYGQVGDGTNTNKLSPTQISSAISWLRIGGGGLHASALSADGQLYTWGNNASGELGDGSMNNQNAPLLITGQTGIVALQHLSPISTNTAVLPATRARICMTGYNNFGELGDGGNTNAVSYSCNNNICPKYQLASTPQVLSLDLTGAGSRTDFQSGCTISGSVMPTGANPVAGTLTSSAWLESSLPSYNGRPLLARHFEMTPDLNAGTATAEITLYVAQADFNLYNAASSHGQNLPSSVADPLGEAANIRIVKFSGISSNGSGLPATYSGSPAIIRPSAAVYDSVAGVWKISFPVSGFSGFFIQSSVFVLPLELLRFGARAVSEQLVRVDWELAQPGPGQEYMVERSADGSHFEAIGTVSGQDLKSYRFDDTSPLRGRSWYRLKVVGRDGAAEYSGVASVILDSRGSLQLSPSPAHDWIELRSSGPLREATVLDVQGRRMMSCAAGQTARIDIRTLAAGVYLLRTDGGEVLRFVKE